MSKLISIPLTSFCSTANKLWSELDTANRLVESSLRNLDRLSQESPSEYLRVMQKASLWSSTAPVTVSDEISLAVQKFSESMQVSAI